MPTIREVGALVGLRSPATVLKHLRTLEKEGLISLSGKSRGIRLVHAVSLKSVLQLRPRSAQVPGPIASSIAGRGASRVAGMGAKTGVDGVAEIDVGGVAQSNAGGVAESNASRGGTPGIIRFRGVRVVGAIAAGRPFESYSDGFRPYDMGGYDMGGYDTGGYDTGGCETGACQTVGIDGGGTGVGGFGSGDRGGSHFGGGDFGGGSFGGGNLGGGDLGGDDSEGGDFGGTDFGGGRSTGIQAGGLDLPIDPRIFVESGEVFALLVQGDSMIQAGILDGDYVIIRRQDTVEEGEIAAVIINGEGTLKRWRTRSEDGTMRVSLQPANERFDPIEIAPEDGKEVLIFGKYVGLVRGNLRIP